MKLLFWLALIVAAVLWLLRAGKRAAPPGPKPSTGAADGGGETMVRCAHCGVHLPASEALHNPAGLAFCSEEHRLLHR